MDEIDYTKFKDSLKRLEERYNDYLKIKDSSDVAPFLLESVKESCIQRFEICLDTSWKHLKKYLEDVEGLPDVPNSPNGIFKHAFAAKVIDDAELWIEFNAKRGDTTHDYNGKKADGAIEVIASFIYEAIPMYEHISGEKWQS